jgi:hypothetical protein
MARRVLTQEEIDYIEELVTRYYPDNIIPNHKNKRKIELNLKDINVFIPNLDSMIDRNQFRDFISKKVQKMKKNSILHKKDLKIYLTLY